MKIFISKKEYDAKNIINQNLEISLLIFPINFYNYREQL